MKERTLQILRYLTGPCLFSCLSLVADDAADASDKKTSEKMTFNQTYDMVKTKGVTPYAGPVVSGDVDFSIDASYILWHASQGGVEYVYSGFQSPSTPTGKAVPPTSNFLQPQGSVIAPGFKTSSGFKVGVGLDCAYDGWDTSLNYTWLHTRAHSSVNSNDVTGELLPVYNEGFVAQEALASVAGAQLAYGFTTTSAIQIVLPDLISAKSSWRLHFNVLDFDLGRNFFISSKLLMRPHYGFKGTWQKQNNITTYEADGSYNTITQTGYTVANTNSGNGIFNNKLISFNSASTETLAIEFIQEMYQIRAYQSYWGFGPRAGIDLSWLATRNFSVFTDLDVSLLWGQFKATRQDVINIVDFVGNVIVENYIPGSLRTRMHQVNLVLEAQMGLRYDYWFSKDDYRFRAEVAWENQLWLNQNQMITSVDNYGDLSLQGLTVNFQFDF